MVATRPSSCDITSLSLSPHNSAALWFQASEALGDDIAIRFGRLPESSDSVEWHEISHVDCDGIGGFARVLRQHGVEVPILPQTHHACRGHLAPLWNFWRDRKHSPEIATRQDWLPQAKRLAATPNPTAWSVFSEEETRALITTCRVHQVTVNSLLLQQLDAAVRPELGIPRASIPWMIPVNLRGDVDYGDGTANHVSCIDAVVDPEQPVQALHRQILHRLSRGEHRANCLLMRIGGLAPQSLKVRYLARDRRKSAGNIGAFSNLGSWDPDRTIASRDRWLFCPPVVLGQRLSAGCVTFQNQLGLMIQTQPYESAPPELAQTWMDRWVRGLSSLRS